MTSRSPASVLDEVRRSTHQKVKVAVADIDGVLRGKYLHRDKFLSAAETGFGFCNVVFGWDSADVCYDNSAYTGWQTGYPDALAKIDLSTYRRIPWEAGVPFFLGDFVEPQGSRLDDGKGEPLSICPRQLLKTVLARADKAGYRVNAGMEFEWFNFKETPQSLVERTGIGAVAGVAAPGAQGPGFVPGMGAAPRPISPGMFGYSLTRLAQNQPFFSALMEELRLFDVPIEGLHTETGPGVMEAAILYSDALECADRAVLFKQGAREIGSRFGVLPSFMAKWNAKLPGCSGHTHVSVWDGKGEKNLFFDEKHPHRMSAMFQSFVAGWLKALPEILPMFAPTINSYKRLVDGYWAPTRVSWGIDNRTVAARVIPGSSKSTRLEARVPGSDVNPYLAVAALVAAGLHGIEKGLKLTQPATQGSAYAESAAGGGGERLPRNLHEATLRMQESKLARELFGDSFVDHFTGTRQWEWRQFQDAVTSWELDRYFEII